MDHFVNQMIVAFYLNSIVYVFTPAPELLHQLPDILITLKPAAGREEGHICHHTLLGYTCISRVNTWNTDFL